MPDTSPPSHRQQIESVRRTLETHFPAPQGGWPETEAAPERWGIDPHALVPSDPGPGRVLTPPELAHLVAWRLLHHWRAEHPSPPSSVLDPAVGSGSLLLALGVRLPGSARLFGHDIDEARAEAAQRAGERARLDLTAAPGDALLDDIVAERHFDLVITNPPYIGEKGNRGLFERIGRHPRWSTRVGARSDLQYLFLHAALDALAPGGLFAAITTAYWPTATGAADLRSDLARRSRLIEILDLGPLRPFAEAQGQHTLVIVGQRSDDVAPRPATAYRVTDEIELPELVAALHDSDGAAAVEATTWSVPEEPARRWYPCRSDPVARALEALDAIGTSLRTVAVDKQGVVSGADRSANGAPIFRFDTVDEWAHLADAPSIRPLLRGSVVRPFDVVSEPFPDAPRLLYLDGSDSPSPAVLEHLEPHRSRLEARREVRLGRRPWWALQWPRDRAQILGRKLVCPRRALNVRFALEEGAHAVSSDCTLIVPSSPLPLLPLEVLHLLMNSSVVDFQLQHRGKRKGRQIELYSAPLRSVMLPAERDDSALAALAEELAAGHSTSPAELDHAVMAALELPPELRGVVEAHAKRRWSTS